MAVVKSKIIDNLSDNFPNFYKKNLTKLVDIILLKIEDSLKKSERVELRDIFALETKIQKARVSRNPKTKETIQVPEKKTIQFKMSKKWFKKLNNE